jgi:hypothetical protein
MASKGEGGEGFDGPSIITDPWPKGDHHQPAMLFDEELTFWRMVLCLAMDRGDEGGVCLLGSASTASRAGEEGFYATDF